MKLPATTLRSAPARGPFLFAVVSLLAIAAPAFGQQTGELVLGFAPQQTTINFTLGDILHTVHGAFSLKSGNIHFNPSTGAVNGEILVDATSGNSGNSSRDLKMHKEILESDHTARSHFCPIA